MNKYRNRKTEYNGIMYDSKLESEVARELDLLLFAEKIMGYDRQYRLDVIVNDKKICFYKADFCVANNDGTFEIIECKGMWTDSGKLKIRLIHALYPNYIIRIRQINHEYIFDGKFKK